MVAVSPQQPRRYSLAFFLHDGMESIRESSRNATRSRAKTFKCSPTRSLPHPTLGIADGQVGFWEFYSVTGRLFLPHTCLLASVPPCLMHLQPCSMRLGGLVVRVHHVLSCVPRWLVSKLCSSLPGHKHVDMHAVKPEHALRSMLSQFVRFLVKSSDINVTFWRHSGCFQDTWLHVLNTLTIRGLVWWLFLFYVYFLDGTQWCRDAVRLFFLKQPG